MSAIREALVSKRIKGQNLVEVATLLALVGLVFITMQVYVQRGIQGKTRDLTDEIIGKKQRAYTAEEATSKTDTIVSSKIRVSTAEGGSTKREFLEEKTIMGSDSWSKEK